MSIGSNQPFRAAGTASVSASTTSSAVAMVGAGETVLVTNAANAVAFVAFGTSGSTTAKSASLPLLPNSRALLAANVYMTHAAVILTGGTGTVYFTLGDGSAI
jgi:hypothetical protein